MDFFPIFTKFFEFSSIWNVRLNPALFPPRVKLSLWTQRSNGQVVAVSQCRTAFFHFRLFVARYNFQLKGLATSSGACLSVFFFLGWFFELASFAPLRSQNFTWNVWKNRPIVCEIENEYSIFFRCFNFILRFFPPNLDGILSEFRDKFQKIMKIIEMLMKRENILRKIP